MIRCYSDLVQLSTFDERFAYLRLAGVVGRPTFGHERWMNQRFYTSTEWKRVRNLVIARDNGYDLGCPDFPIAGKIMVHHMCPLDSSMLEHSDETILDPEFLISCSIMTHNAIHFGDSSPDNSVVTRSPGDTLLWSPLREGLHDERKYTRQHQRSDGHLRRR